MLRVCLRCFTAYTANPDANPVVVISPVVFCGCSSAVEERRQCKGRLFYGLSPRLLKDSRAIAPKTKSEYRASKYQELLSNSLLERETFKSEYQPAPKANTTKENLTKENDTKAVLIKSEALIKNGALTKVAPKQKHLLSSNVFRGDLSHRGRKDMGTSQSMESQTVGSHPMNAFLYLFGKLSTELLGYEADTDLTQAEFSRLAAFLEKTPQTRWRSLLQAYFASEFEYVQRHRYAVSALANTCNIFLVQRQTAVKHSTDKQATSRYDSINTMLSISHRF